MVQSTAYELTDTYPPDQVLMRMGFRRRVYLQPESISTLSAAFGCGHFQLYRELPGHPVLTTALEHFQTNTSQHPTSLTILRSCLGQVPELMQESVFNSSEFHDLLHIYDSFFPHDLDRKDLIAYLSNLFHVHIVLMVHTASTIVCEFAMMTEEAPIVRLESWNELYGWFQGDSTPRLMLRPEELLDWVRDIADPDMFAYYSAMFEQSRTVAPVPVTPIPPEPKTEDSLVMELKGIIGWQAQYLACLSSWAPQSALPSQTIVAQLQTRGEELGFNPTPYAALANTVAMCAPNHPWEECAYFSSDLKELPCGHHLCPFHMAHLGQCPWSCPS